MSIAVKSVLHRGRELVFAGVLGAALSLASWSAVAQGLDYAGRAALSSYTVTKPVLSKILAIARAAQAKGIRVDGEISLSDQTVSLQDLVASLEAKSELINLIKAQGMDARSFILGDLALMQGALVAQGGGGSQFIGKLLGKANPANLTFYKSHKQQVVSLMALASGKSSDALHFSAQDKRELAEVQKMGPEKFEECTKIAFVDAPISGAFAVAVATSAYGPTQLKPGVFVKMGKVLEDLSANVPDQVPSDALYKMGRQIELQEGRRPAEITSTFTSAINRLKAWVEVNCAVEQARDASAKNAGKGAGVALGPAAAPRPVSKVATDAPAAAFGQLSMADVAILHAAAGIQLGDEPGPAAMQVIFDPNAPYGARLYQQLRKSQPDLAVRWVPIAYIAKNSAAVAAILLNSHNPKQDLNADLLHYDFARHHGGVQPGADHSDSLPPGQIQLRKAWEKWGGYTPMIIFRDESGRWLQTGGSGEAAIDSVLARAAK